MTTGTHRPPPAGTPRRVLAAAARRLPTLLALALAVVTFADGVPPLGFLAGLLVVMPLCYLAFGVLRGELRDRRALLVQTGGLLGFTGLALCALAAGGTAGLALVAAGWLAHAGWDLAHHRSGKVVPRAWSEWCGVVDAAGAVAMTALIWTA
ncbi:hypothetical protein [Streptomyces sp. NPDC012888]|uniref:hypothetical protein n=1 Tax=Streptomyces sp. NPDC012888 TaxID=3364855 RepID=UPI00369CF26C